jgi:hypothetical protein
MQVAVRYLAPTHPVILVLKEEAGMLSRETNIMTPLFQANHSHNINDARSGLTTLTRTRMDFSIWEI